MHKMSASDIMDRTEKRAVALANSRRILIVDVQ